MMVPSRGVPTRSRGGRVDPLRGAADAAPDVRHGAGVDGLAFHASEIGRLDRDQQARDLERHFPDAAFEFEARACLHTVFGAGFTIT